MTAIARPVVLDDPRLRLVILHHAGGSPAVFRNWSRFFPGDWELCPVDLAVHRHTATTMPTLITRLADELAPLTDVPVGIFGHSMGAVVGFALATELRRRPGRTPVWLGVSAYPSPRTRHLVNMHLLHRLPTDELRELTSRLGDIPLARLRNEQLWALIESRLRRDLELLGTWRPETVDPLPIPLRVFCGRDDAAVPVWSMRSWSAYSSHYLGLLSLPGGHFYFTEVTRQVADQVVEDCTTVLGV
jgi:surfactin synthase thioesterase subunit